MLDASLQAAIEIAAARLDAGRLVAFPTETVYGLGADASDARAVAAIFTAKGRPNEHPVIVHLPEGADPLQWASQVPAMAARLIDRFWPGPLTLILPRRAGVGEAAAGGQDTIGLRCPSHPTAQRVLSGYAAIRRSRDASAPIGVAAPSANRFGHVSPTSASHVVDEFADASTRDANAGIFVVDGGACPVGIESTIVDCSRLDASGLVLLRPGAVTAAMIAEEVGIEPRAADSGAPRAPGTIAVHYAPLTPLRVVDADALAVADDDVAVWSYTVRERGERRRWHVAPSDPERYAHELYATLRSLDAIGAREIWIERPPQTREWAGINDRLMRAAAGAGIR